GGAGHGQAHPCRLNLQGAEERQVFSVEVKSGGEALHKESILYHVVYMGMCVQDGGDLQPLALDDSDQEIASECWVDDDGFAGIRDEVGVVVEGAEPEGGYFHAGVIPEGSRWVKDSGLDAVGGAKSQKQIPTG